MSTPPLEPHREYYLPGGDLYLRVGNVLFRAHSYFFERDSSKFKDILRAPLAPNQVRLGSTDSDPIVIKHGNPRDFAKFLWVFYNPLYSVYEATSAEWIGVLKIACEYDFVQVRNLAIRCLDQSGLSVVQRLQLYLLYRADPIHVVPLYTLLCMRDDGPTDGETELLGTKTVLLIWRMREHLRAQSPSSVLAEEDAVLTVCSFLGVNRSKLNSGGSGRRRRVPIDPLPLASSANSSTSFPRPMVRAESKTRDAYVYGDYFSCGPGPEGDNSGNIPKRTNSFKKFLGSLKLGKRK